MSVIINPIEQYFNLDGSPLTNGYLYFGVPFGNPVTEPSTVYFDPEFTIPAAQPVRTVNGYPVRSGTATGLFAPDDVSILIQNSNKEQVIYIESSSVSAVQTNTFYRDSNQLLTADDNNKIFIATLPFTQTIDASVALGSAWSIQYVNMSNGLIIFDPNLSETIDGQATVSLQPNHSIFIRCDGVNLTSTSSPYPVQSIASAPTLDLTVTKSKLINITGVATITSVSMINGDVIKAIASGAFQLTNSSSLIVQGNANYTTTVNDILTFTKDGAGNVHVEIQRINGKSVVPTDFASSAEVKTGTESAKAIAPNNLLAAQGFTSYYESSNQTITSGGALTIAHGLGRKPILVQFYLKNLSAEAGYSVGDELYVPPSTSNSGADTQGVAYVPDATNLNIRYGGSGSVFTSITKNTGGVALLTNSSWALIIRAWA